MKKFLLIPRLQNYYLFINTFDCLDYSFISKLNKITKFKNCKFKINNNENLPYNINNSNFTNLYIQSLNLEWNCIQRFYLKFKNKTYNFNQISLQNVIRKHKLYEFLEYCWNSIFIDKLVKIKKDKKNYKIQILNKTQWNEFRCNSSISDYFFYNKKSNLNNLVSINFTNKKFNLNNQFFKLNLLP